MKVYEFLDYSDFKRAALLSHERKNLLEAYSFLPEDELIEKLSMKSRFVPVAAVIGALTGALGGFLLQYIPNTFLWQMNIGGRPTNSWPAFLLITFESSVLTCAFFIVGAFILGNKFPRFDREIFGLDSYNEHRHDRYFIVTEKEDQDVRAYAVHDLSRSSL